MPVCRLPPGLEHVAVHPSTKQGVRGSKSVQAALSVESEHSFPIGPGEQMWFYPENQLSVHTHNGGSPIRDLAHSGLASFMPWYIHKMSVGKPPVPLEKGSALIVVDVQNDFCTGGALGIPQGESVIPELNRWIQAFRDAGLPIAYSRDWHPLEHCSFKARGGPWPPHCIQGSAGAGFREGLEVNGALFCKAFDADRDAYSAFEALKQGPDGALENLSLPDWLRAQGVRHVYIGGLATDYCVKHTALDALRDGMEVTVIGEGVRGVDVQPGDSERAMEEMEQAGAEIR